MELRGLDAKLEGTEETENWRKAVTEYTEQYWNETETGRSPPINFTEVDTVIIRQEFFLGDRRGLEHKSGKTRNLASIFNLRIIFKQVYTFKGSLDSTVPSETYLNPLSEPSFLQFLKDTDTNSMFTGVTSISVKEVVGPPETSSPTETPSPSLQPSVLTPKHNGDDTDFKLIVIILGVIAGVLGLCSIALIVWPFLRRTPPDEIDEGDTAVAANLAGGNVTPTAGNTSRGSPKEIIEVPDPQDTTFTKNSLAFVDDDVSDLGSQEVTSPGKIDLSVFTTEGKDNDGEEEEDPQFSVDGGDDDSVMNDSDSMLSFDVYSNASDDVGSDEFVVVPKGSPRPARSPRSDSGEGTAKKPQTQVENLVISGAPLSPSKEDGPKIGSTKIIEGKGELKGVKLLAVGDIDEASSPHSTFSA